MSERISKIVEAISHLNPSNPSHFLSDGETPQISVLEELTGFEDITAAERDEALKQVNEPLALTPSTSTGETVRIIAKTVVRVEEGEEQLAWGSKFFATKVEMEDSETGEDVVKMVLLGEFEKSGYEHESLMNAVPRRGIMFRGTLI